MPDLSHRGRKEVLRIRIVGPKAERVVPGFRTIHDR